MKIPAYTDERYRRLVTGHLKVDFKCFATKVMLTKLHISIFSDNSEKNIVRCCKELCEYFNQNKHAAKEDIDLLFGNGDDSVS